MKRFVPHLTCLQVRGTLLPEDGLGPWERFLGHTRVANCRDRVHDVSMVLRKAVVLGSVQVSQRVRVKKQVAKLKLYTRETEKV